MTRDFEGKTAIVTGASSGIGRATAVAFGEQGANVVVAARREAQSLETARLVEQAGGNAVFARTDVTIPDDVERMVETALQQALPHAARAWWATIPMRPSPSCRPPAPRP